MTKLTKTQKDLIAALENGADLSRKWLGGSGTLYHNGKKRLVRYDTLEALVETGLVEIREEQRGYWRTNVYVLAEQPAPDTAPQGDDDTAGDPDASGNAVYPAALAMMPEPWLALALAEAAEINDWRTFAAIYNELLRRKRKAAEQVYAVGEDGAAGEGDPFGRMSNDEMIDELATTPANQHGTTAQVFDALKGRCGNRSAVVRLIARLSGTMRECESGEDGESGCDGCEGVPMATLGEGDVFLWCGVEHTLVYRGAEGAWALREDNELVRIAGDSDTLVIKRRTMDLAVRYSDEYFTGGHDGAAGGDGAETPTNAPSRPASVVAGAAATQLAQDAQTAFNPFSVAVETLEYGDVVEVTHDGKAYKYFCLGMVGGYALALENLHDTETVLLEGRVTYLYRSNKVSPIFPAGLIEWRNREPQHAAKYKYSFDERPQSYEYSEAWEQWYSEGACWRSDARWQWVNAAIFAPREQGRF